MARVGQGQTRQSLRDTARKNFRSWKTDRECFSRASSPATDQAPQIRKRSMTWKKTAGERAPLVLIRLSIPHSRFRPSRGAPSARGRYLLQITPMGKPKTQYFGWNLSFGGVRRRKCLRNQQKDASAEILRRTQAQAPVPRALTGARNHFVVPLTCPDHSAIRARCAPHQSSSIRR